MQKKGRNFVQDFVTPKLAGGGFPLNFLDLFLRTLYKSQKNASQSDKRIKSSSKSQKKVAPSNPSPG